MEELLISVLNQDYIQTDIRITIDGTVYDSSIFKKRPSIEKTTDKLCGDFIMTKATFELNDRENTLDVQDKEVLIEKAVYIDGIWSWYKLGYFTITEIKSDKSAKTIKCTAYDRTQLFNTKSESALNWDIKHTGLEIVQELLNKYHLELDGVFAFADYEFDQPNFPNNTSERDVIARLAEIGGEHAIITNEGKLKFVRPKETLIKIEGRHRTEYSLEIPDKKIGQIALGKKNINDDYINGENVEEEQTYRIEDNPYCDLDRATIAPFVHENITGMQGREFEIKGLIGAELLNINDKITLIENNTNESILTVRSIKTDGTIKGDIGASKIEYKSSNYAIAGSTKQQIEDTKLDVDHVKNEITGVVSSVESQNFRIDLNDENIEELKTQGNELRKNYTEIKQTVDNVSATVQSQQGENLIENSKMFTTNESKAPDKWVAEDIDETNKFIRLENDYGAILTGGRLKQEFITDSNIISISFLLDKDYYSEAIFKLIQDNNALIELKIDKLQFSDVEYKYENIEVTPDVPIITSFEVVGNNLTIDNLMVNVGERAKEWSKHSNEISGNEMLINDKGLNMRVLGDYEIESTLLLNPYELTATYKGEKSFGINKDNVFTDKLMIKSQAEWGDKIKAVVTKDGLGFAKIESRG